MADLRAGPEAASIAGHLGLGKLVYLYDDNHITIDGTTSLSFSREDKGDYLLEKFTFDNGAGDTVPGYCFLPKTATADKKALQAALQKANFTSLRGGFKFNTNHYPIQDFYLTKVAKRADGKFQTEIVKKVFSNDADIHAKDCPMK